MKSIFIWLAGQLVCHPAGWLTSQSFCIYQNFDIRLYVQALQPFFFIPTMHICTIDFHRFVSFSGQNSSVGSVFGSLSCVMQHHGFDSPWGNLAEGIFPLS